MRRKFQEPIIKRIRKTMLGKNKFRFLTATLAFTMLTSSFYYPLKMDVVAAGGVPQVGGVLAIKMKINLQTKLLITPKSKVQTLKLFQTY